MPNQTLHPITIDLDFQGNTESVAVFLLRTSEGPVLVESGPYSTFKHLESKLQTLGISAKEVKHVFLTHIHLDHAGAAWAFAALGATIHVHPFGLAHLMSPEKLMHSARQIYKDDMVRLWGDMQPIENQRLHAVAHGESVQIGDHTFQAWHTPGHANHHIAWQLGDVLFAGDVAGVKVGKGPVVPPCPPPDIDLGKWEESIALMRKLDVSCFYLTHYGKITNCAQHLTSLSEALGRYAGFIRARMQEGLSQADILPKFEAFVNNHLLESGLDDAAIARYQIANPAWMSVGGLCRYWNKQELKK